MKEFNAWHPRSQKVKIEDRVWSLPGAKRCLTPAGSCFFKFIFQILSRPSVHTDQLSSTLLKSARLVELTQWRSLTSIQSVDQSSGVSASSPMEKLKSWNLFYPRMPSIMIISKGTPFRLSLTRRRSAVKQKSTPSVS